MENIKFIDEPWDELLDGKLVSMSPPATANHNIVSGNIFRLFGNYLDGKPCMVFGDGLSVHLTENDRVIPDVTVVCNKDIVKQNGVHGAPDLVVEVLSHGTAKKDKGYKKDLYERCGVKEYWIVDVEHRTIEVYLLKENKYYLDEVYALLPDYVVEDMTKEEKSKIVKEFHPSMFCDLTISLDKVFKNPLTGI